MGPIRKLGVAVVMAAVMAGGLGTATLEAKKKGGGGVDPHEAVCSYLKSILDYEYLSPYIRPTVEAQYYDTYHCATR